MAKATPKTESRRCSGCGKRMQVRTGQASDPTCKACRGPASSHKSACDDCGKVLWVRSAQVSPPRCYSCRERSVVHGKVSTYLYRKCRCPLCRASWNQRCNDRQKKARRDRGLLKVKACVICGTEFNPHGQQVTCSPHCRRKYAGKICDHRSRAIFYGGEHEKVSRVDVFERDGWVCGVCREPVDPQAAYPDPMSASLDHVVPLSRGGSHTADNAQCAHLACNRRKGCSV